MAPTRSVGFGKGLGRNSPGVSAESTWKPRVKTRIATGYFINAVGTAQRWQLTSGNSINHLGNITLTNGILSDIVPVQSITLFVLQAVALGTFSLQIGGKSQAGQVALWLDGQAGQTYILQSSTNLVNWPAVSTNTLSSNSFEFFLPTTNSSRMFYRGLWNGL